MSSFDDGPASGEPRRLSHALREAWPDFQAFEVDDRNGTARGIVPIHNGHGPVATLGFTHEIGLLRIDVELGRPSETRILVLLEVPFCTRWTRAMWGRDDGIAWLRAASVCEELGDAGPVIRALAHDLSGALRSELLRLAMGDEWAAALILEGGAA